MVLHRLSAQLLYQGGYHLCDGIFLHLLLITLRKFEQILNHGCFVVLFRPRLLHNNTLFYNFL